MDKFITRGSSKVVLVEKENFPSSSNTKSLPISSPTKCDKENGEEPPSKIVSEDVSGGLERLAIRAINEVDSDNSGLRDFEYITDVVYRLKGKLDPSTMPQVSCECSGGGDCGEEGLCLCVLRGGDGDGEAPVYTKVGTLEPDASVLARDVLVECGPQCPCSADCRLRVVQKGPRYRLELFKTERCGWGLRSAEDYIPQGAFVAQYVGEVLTSADANRRQDDSYILEQPDSQGLAIDAVGLGNVARFANHSCDPTMECVRVVWGQEGLRYARVALFTSQEVVKGEELTFDYSPSYWTQKRDGLLCACGTDQCRYSTPEKIQAEKKKLTKLKAELRKRGRPQPAAKPKKPRRN